MRKRTKYLMIGFVIIILIFAGSAMLKNSNNNEVEVVNEEKPAEVVSMQVGVDVGMDLIEAVGTVKPESKVEAVALTRGTVQSVMVEQGDFVYAGQAIAHLYDSSTITSLNNAILALNNSQISYNSAEILTDDSITQAEINLSRAEIGYKSAKTNYENAVELQKQKNQDLFTNAVISYNSNLNFVFNTLEKVNTVIGAEGNVQINGIDSVLGALDHSKKINAKSSYNKVKVEYDILKNQKVDRNSVENFMPELEDLLDLTEKMTFDTVVLLNKTVKGSYFSQAALDGLKIEMNGLHGQAVQSLNSVQALSNQLENLEKYNEQEITPSKSAYDSAKQQLDLAEIAFESTKQSKEQQLANAETALNGASTQVQLAQIQTNYLTIVAPISGTITGKYVELGAEINPGMKVAEISDTNLVKVEIDVPVEQAQKIVIGQSAFINNNLTGIVSNISPVADAMNKKVNVEVVYDNKNNDLTVNTSVNVVIIAEKNLKNSNSQVSYFVPLKAVSMGQTESYVFVANKDDEQGKTFAKKVIVKVGEMRGAEIEVLAGLDHGDFIIVEGGKFLDDGQEIVVLK